MGFHDFWQVGKIFLTSAEKDNFVQNHLGCKKWQKCGANFTPKCLIQRDAFLSVGTLPIEPVPHP